MSKFEVKLKIKNNLVYFQYESVCFDRFSDFRTVVGITRWKKKLSCDNVIWNYQR